MHVDGNYDDGVAAARLEVAHNDKALLVVDTVTTRPQGASFRSLVAFPLQLSRLQYDMVG